jgi:exopolyphosphatase / guanosine-5'-triphosphate,3'-diphosphate pyrophosphatase
VDATKDLGPANGRTEQQDQRSVNRDRNSRAAAADFAANSEPCYGALDLGTNNCRLLIARRRNGGFDVVDAFSRIVRLGEGLGVSGMLNAGAMARTIEALRVCSNKLKWHGVAKQRLVATEACRSAGNGAEFIDRVFQETGLALEIVDRQSEARLAAAGAAPLIEPGARSALIFDIGGGSTEVMWMEQGGAEFIMKAWTSLPAGVVTLSERVGGGRNVTVEMYDTMKTAVRGHLQPFIQQVRETIDPDTMPSHLLGTSGTVTTIAGVHLGLRSYDRGRVDGSWLGDREMRQVVDRLRAMSYEERMQNGCIGRERADLVLAGCAILDEIHAAFPASRIRVADRGLREGILSDLLKDDA